MSRESTPKAFPGETPIPGVVVLDMPMHEDERGLFSRIYCRQSMEEWGLDPIADQWSLSANPRRGTLRGLHYQAPPLWECKLVRCVAGAVFDVVVDLRRGSPAYGRHFAIELSAANRKSLYVPRGLAHGFLTLEDDSTLLYGITPGYVPSAACGIRWNDPDLAIPWPMAPSMISSRDAALPSWQENAASQDAGFRLPVESGEGCDTVEGSQQS